VYNIRYHIASLVAVFLALTVGLLLGTVVVERGVASRQRTALVEGLRKDFGDIRETNATLGAENDQMRAFSEEALAVLSRGALGGRTIVVLADPTRGDAVARASDAIKLAGGTPVVATFAGPGLGMTDSAAFARVGRLLGVTETMTLTGKVSAALATEWTVGAAGRAVTAELVSGERLALEGMPASGTIGGVVVVGTFESEPDPALIGLAGDIGKAGRPALGAESARRPTGVAQAAAKAGLSAVDDLDAPLGRLSLVWVLSGRAKGHYGFGTGADSAYPKPLFSTP
jgi:hypothetical protein